jgi:hypothetical protein
MALSSIFARTCLALAAIAGLAQACLPYAVNDRVVFAPAGPY